MDQQVLGMVVVGGFLAFLALVATLAARAEKAHARAQAEEDLRK